MAEGGAEHFFFGPGLAGGFSGMGVSVVGSGLVRLVKMMDGWDFGVVRMG